MLKKIFKTIFIMSLCIGISLPSNAAVSVSDGSAFVTKAEFAADLNNLSNRMALLENSLDAKIDSLVSSYLTRNGIWNGARQDLLSTSYVLDNSPAKTFNRGGNYGFTSSYASLFLSNKSGLAYFSFRYRANTDATNFCRYGVYYVEASNSHWVSDDKIILTCEIIESGGSLLSSFILGSTLATRKTFHPNEDWRVLHMPTPLNYTAVNSLFFVSKGVEYGFRIVVGTYIFTCSTESGKNNITSDGTAGILFSFDNVLVY